MSLFVPTLNDHIDAHGELEEVDLYEAKIATLQGTEKYRWNFEVVDGFFKQSDEATDDQSFDFSVQHAGRKKLWKDIQIDLKKLNDSAADNEIYKLVFFARHGQGYHNVVVEKYGMVAWELTWHNKITDGEFVIGPDPELTPLGITQAEANHTMWKKELELGAPMPSKFYVSPLQRSSKTLVITWKGLKPDSIRPVVTENIRERIGANICDKRSSKTIIRLRFEQYGFVFPELLTEEDELYTVDYREKLHEQAVRANGFLQSLFDENLNNGKVDRKSAHENSFISTTSHGGMIRSFILALGHRPFSISTGGMIPIVIKATRK